MFWEKFQRFWDDSANVEAAAVALVDFVYVVGSERSRSACLWYTGERREPFVIDRFQPFDAVEILSLSGIVERYDEAKFARWSATERAPEWVEEKIRSAVETILMGDER
jgi:hypothetical protein